MPKYVKLRKIKQTKRHVAIRDRFVSGPEDVKNVRLTNGKGRRTALQRQNISDGMANARLKGKVLGRPIEIETQFKRGETVRILKQLDMGIPQARIVRELNADGIKISKASFSRLIKKLRCDKEGVTTKPKIT